MASLPTSSTFPFPLRDKTWKEGSQQSGHEYVDQAAMFPGINKSFGS